MAIAELFNGLGKYVFILPQNKGFITEDSIPIAGTASEYAEEGQEIYRLSATKNFSKTESASITTNPMSIGSNISDNYRWSDTTINFTGVISTTVVGLSATFDYLVDAASKEDGDSSTAVTRYIAGLRKLVRGESKYPLVTIYLPDGNGETNCVITNMEINKDHTLSNGYNVSISAKKIQAVTSNIQVIAAGAELTPEVKTTPTSASKEYAKAPIANRF